MFINHTSKQVTAKIVYYGPGLSGKTTNLQYIFSITNPMHRGELVSIETEIERTLFFDLLPLNVGQIKGYHTKFQLYTVPGQIFYDSTRKMVLKGADGIVFVVDSQRMMEAANIESFKNLKKNLMDQNQYINEVPLVFQFNKRDLNSILTIDKLNKILNKLNKPFFESIAIKGTGIIETLREISSLTLKKIKIMIDHSEQKAEIKPIVQFNMDPKHEIIKKEELPFKKISVENMEEINKKMNTSKKEIEVKKIGKRVEIKKNESKKVMNNENELKKIKGYDILDSFENKSRITILKKISLKNPHLSIELKDKNSNSIESIELETKPETKKITIILDIKE